MKYPGKGAFRDCRWCRGKGCVYCEGEARKAYERAFLDGPKPIATFDTTTPEGVEAAKAFVAGLMMGRQP